MTSVKGKWTLLRAIMAQLQIGEEFYFACDDRVATSCASKLGVSVETERMAAFPNRLDAMSLAQTLKKPTALTRIRRVLK